MKIQGSTFTLREWHWEDALPLQHHANNSLITDCLTDRFPNPYTLEDAVKWIAARQNQDPMINFAIADLDSDKVIGGIGLELQQDIYRQTPLLGYWLGEEYWGRGIVTEATRLLTAYAFDTLEAICVQARVLSKNPASMRVLEKAGYVKQGVLQHSVVKAGKILDEHLYAIWK
ncbi:GNAT family N-acetyltransferase [Mucilaginibacter robiniae]|uniref:GNAT family N-acetyltransferase n=1 Tax=Mucilaginibacter robiniae TaxID=2728022 RepID=A0A7L5E0R6_9SPHI|nr:GNAT family protein [Mucilaginibacter robiniae]QJD95879.1 GNAT family N-acetyltransferase [Mucilaginibacter robiniae]